MTPRKQFAVRMPVELAERVRELAQEDDRSLNSAFVNIVRRGLEIREKERLLGRYK